MIEVNQEMLIRSYVEQYGSKVISIKMLKPNRIYRLESESVFQVLKIFDQDTHLHWQVKCLRQLEERNVHGIIPYTMNNKRQYVNLLPHTSLVYGVLPYISGRPMDPSKSTEIKDCISLLGHFHSNGKGIYGLEQEIPLQSLWLQKLVHRFELFSRSIHSHDGVVQVDGLLAFVQKLALDASSWAKWVIDHFPQSQMLYLEEQAQWERQIAHLDVAPHNFMVQENGSYYLMDYDLMQYSPVVVDVAQFIHRALMYYHWSIDVVMELLQEYQRQRVIDQIEYQLILLLLIYPHDIFREWLGVWKQQSGFQVKKVIDFFQQLESTWENRRKFVRACQAMLK